MLPEIDTSTGYQLTIYNKFDNGTTSYLFYDVNNCIFWVNQCRLYSLHFDLYKLCKRHAPKMRTFHPVKKCCKLIISE